MIVWIGYLVYCWARQKLNKHALCQKYWLAREFEHYKKENSVWCMAGCTDHEIINTQSIYARIWRRLKLKRYIIYPCYSTTPLHMKSTLNEFIDTIEEYIFACCMLHSQTYIFMNNKIIIPFIDLYSFVISFCTAILHSLCKERIYIFIQLYIQRTYLLQHQQCFIWKCFSLSLTIIRIVSYIFTW